MASTNGKALMNVDRAGRFAFNRTALRSPVYNQFEMCPRPAYGEPSSCNKRRFGFGGPKFPTDFPRRTKFPTDFPRRIVPKDGEGAKKDAEKKVDQTSKLPVLKF